MSFEQLKLVLVKYGNTNYEQELQALDEERRRTRRNSEAVLPTKPPPEAHAKGKPELSEPAKWETRRPYKVQHTRRSTFAAFTTFIRQICGATSS